MSSFQPQPIALSRFLQSPQEIYQNDSFRYNNYHSSIPDLTYHEPHQDPEQRQDYFPFGKERSKISRQIMHNMNSQKDQYNKKILQKFRIDAIKHRNQRVMKHLGKMPYVTESMLLGSSVDLNRFMQKPSQFTHQQIRHPPPQKYIFPNYETMQIKNSVQPVYPIVKSPRKKIHQSQSIGVTVNFEEEFPISSKKMKKKRRSYTIQQHKEHEAMDKITDLLLQINQKIKRNTEVIEQKVSLNKFEKQRNIKQSRQKKYMKNFQQLGILQNEKLPSIEYNLKQKKKVIRSEASQRSSQEYIRDHLQLLKKNKRRLEDLDNYVYG